MVGKARAAADAVFSVPIIIYWQIICWLFSRNVTALPWLTVDCAERHFTDAESFVCVCNATYCDRPLPAFATLGNAEGADKRKASMAMLFVSDPNKSRLRRQYVPLVEEEEEEDDHAMGKKKKEDSWLTIRVNASARFQQVVGFGGAFTDSAMYVLNTLTEPTRATLLRAYFDKNIGIRYTVGRVPMGATDFSLRDYSYCDTPEDLNLTTFMLAKADTEWKIPNIRAANALSGDELRLFATPWSAPGWMKTNGRMVGVGTLKGALDGPYYKAFANYFKRFFEEYQRQGNVSFWGLTLTNEPLHGQRPGMSMNSSIQRWHYGEGTKLEESDWANKVLAPLLQQSALTKNVTMMAHDDNRHLLFGAIFGAWNGSTNVIAGLGVHWYSPPDYPYDVLTKVHTLYPNKFLLATEACSGAMERAEHAGPSLGNWTRALQYGHDIIQDLRNWAIGWVDWNICLDTIGGPSWAQNFVDSPVIVNGSKDEFYKQPTFYVMAHFSRFIPSNSVRIGAELVGNKRSVPDGRQAHGSGVSGGVEFVAFRQPAADRRRVLVLLSRLNRTVKVKVIEGTTTTHRRRVIRVQLPPKGIATLLWHK